MDAIKQNHTDWYVIIDRVKMQNDNRPWWHFWQCSRCCGEQVENARQKILEAAFHEIHRVGFQAASIQNILKETGLTKGALYHHFPNKQALGYAVVDEIIQPLVHFHWIKPLQHGNHPIDALIKSVQQGGEQMTMDDIMSGCPLTNLTQEMSSIDEGFRKRTEGLYLDWRKATEIALEEGKKKGQVIEDVNTEQFAIVFIATLEGCLTMAKSSQSLELLLSCGSGVISLLEGLRGETK